MIMTLMDMTGWMIEDMSVALECIRFDFVRQEAGTSLRKVEFLLITSLQVCRLKFQLRSLEISICH